MGSHTGPRIARRAFLGALLAAPKPHAGAQDKTIGILCIGDSLTSGQELPDGGFRSYRGALQRHLATAGWPFRMLGTQLRAPAIGGDPHHDGYGGARIGPDAKQHNIFDRLDSILAPTVAPDIVVLALGWNSVFQEPAEAAGKYFGLLAEVARRRPDARLVAATLSPLRGLDATETGVRLPGYRALNDAARRWAAAARPAQSALADLAVAEFLSSEYVDSIHWNQAGADRAGSVIFRALAPSPARPSR